MTMRKIFASLFVTMFFISIPTAINAQLPAKGNIEGTWNAVLKADGEDFQENERYTFIFDRTGLSGSLIFSNEVDSVPPCGTDQGVWVKTAKRSFVITHGAFCSDLAMGGPAYSLKYRETIGLNDAETQFTGRGVLEVSDPAGNLLFSATYTVTGVRMPVESPGDAIKLNSQDAAAENQTPAEKLNWTKLRRLISPK